MGYRLTERHRDTVQKVLAQIKDKIKDDKQRHLLENFVEHYYAIVAEEDLVERNVMDLYGAVVSHWNFAYHRDANESKVRLYNPEYEQHGWKSTHTIIEIVVDDMPFLVDSIRMELTKHGYTIHQMINPGHLCITRNKQGKITNLACSDKVYAKGQTEAILYIEIDQECNNKALEAVREDLLRVIKDVQVTVDDWEQMSHKAIEFADNLAANPPAKIDKAELTETVEFIRWIANNNFTFLGCRDYELDTNDLGEPVLTVVKGSGLGQLRDERVKHATRNIAELSAQAKKDALSSDSVLVIQQLSDTSTVHRPSAPYYIGLKRFDKKGKVIGERRFIGLYTSVAYHSRPTTIPFLRKKVQSIMDMANLFEQSHSGKHLLNILETYPRDELFQSTEEELYLTVMGIFHLQERRRIKLFLRKDPYNRFYSALVFVPRDQFNSALREKMGQVLIQNLGGSSSSFTTQFSESILARIHFIIRVNPQDERHQHLVDINELQRKVSMAALTWEDDLVTSLQEYYGEARCAKLMKKYNNAFPAGYREYFPARTTVYDIEHMESLDDEKQLAMSFYRPLESIDGDLHFKLYCHDTHIALSDILPMLENMGLRVIGERSHDIRTADGSLIWLSDFKMTHQSGQSINVDRVRELFQTGFANTWLGNAENDGFNCLILAAELDWRQTAMLRTYAKYMRQIGFTFSQQYIEETLAKYPIIVQYLTALFEARFNPEHAEGAQAHALDYKEKIIKELDSVDSLDEDRIIRRYLDLILATLRTNFYQKAADGSAKSYISLKIDPTAVPDMPLPRPMFEFFVYSPRVEGVHLRSAKVARGGLRWSDRREDFRTEVLGLMKAQQVKNAVIVPAGAKGGFVCKSLPESGNRDELMQEVVACYSTFISGILDLTDNLIGGEVVSPEQVVRYDEDDYYLVVAADKGTATFSDIANGISQKYGFWLGDAFASGGSEGYDHKKMGITARGAWESVKRHFLEFGHDVQSTPFTVVGIGDMGGDVFGNGMLCSQSICLVAAFNHMHIFIDPNPEPQSSFQERQRLFELPRSTWADYNTKLISKGGGVFSRFAKQIKLTPEIKKLLGVKVDFMVPNELIQHILKAEVDLLWNGGIGTYVKGTKERNIDVGDRANDSLRINGSELRAKVVGEGGNLGLTQLGRVEYALHGGVSFTDFIDNVGGVDCSDHEVNIKILLDSIVKSGDLTEKQRNEMLLDMTDEVSELVLTNNYHQTRALSLASLRAPSTLDEYRRFISALERMERLDRSLEFLPQDDELSERKAKNLGLTRPELSVLLAYSKILLKEELLASDVPEDPFLSKIISTAFPKRLAQEFNEQMSNHRMSREIVATQLSNVISNEMGATFVKRLFDETGAPAPFVARCFMAAREIFDMNTLWKQIEAVDTVIDAQLQLNMMTDVVRLLRRSTRWFLRNRRLGINIGETVKHFKPKIKELADNLPNLLTGRELEQYQKRVAKYVEQKVPEELAKLIAATGPMISALDIIEAAQVNKLPVSKVAEAYFILGATLQLDWFRSEIGSQPVASNWDALARAACKDDLDRQQRSITEGVLAYKSDDNDINHSLELWMQEHQILVERWFFMVADLKATKSKAFTMFTVALRELLDIAQASMAKES